MSSKKSTSHHKKTTEDSYKLDPSVDEFDPHNPEDQLNSDWEDTHAEFETVESEPSPEDLESESEIEKELAQFDDEEFLKSLSKASRRANKGLDDDDDDDLDLDDDDEGGLYDEEAEYLTVDDDGVDPLDYSADVSQYDTYSFGLPEQAQMDPDLSSARLHREEHSEKLRELVKIAEAKGFITHDDINEVLPASVLKDTDIETYLAELSQLGIDVIEESQVEAYKAELEPRNGENKNLKVDFFDDPIRMYLHQMGQVPLLTRDQEVDICMRIEKSERTVREIFNRFGFAPRMYKELIAKIESGDERFDRVVTDKYVDSREAYMEQLPRLKIELDKLHTHLDKQAKLVAEPHLKAAEQARRMKVMDKYRTDLKNLSMEDRKSVV